MILFSSKGIKNKLKSDKYANTIMLIQENFYKNPILTSNYS